MSKGKDPALGLAIEIAGGPAALARFITEHFDPITAQAICGWRRCPPRRVIAVESATADKAGRPRVSRRRLRPDLYPEGAHESLRRDLVPA